MATRADGAARRATRIALAGILAAFVACACVLALNAQPAQAASDSLTSWSKASGAKNFSKAKQGKTCGKASGKALVAVKVKNVGKTAGNVSYTVGFASGKASASNGKEAAKKDKAIQWMSVKLSGKLKSAYNVYYRVHVKDYGWMGWAKNGAKAGSAGCKLDITAFEVQLQAKGADVTLDTDRAAFCKKGGFLVSITGKAAIDKKIIKVAKKCKMDLKKCFDWSADKIAYGMTGLDVIRTSGAWKDKRIQDEADLAFGKKRGDCYTYTVAFYCLAKYLGYETRPMAGTSMTANGQINTSWTEVDLGGEWMVCDPLHAAQDVYMMPQSGFEQSYQHYAK